MPTLPEAIIIGAGFTGCALAHDLSLRGFKVSVLDRGEIASGTSGRTHGLLHSGGRYCVNDQEAAIECIEENIILRRIAAQCIEYNGGLFIGLNERDQAYLPHFMAGAEACKIPVEQITPQKALQLEPNLNPALLSAVLVPDGVFDPLRLALAFAATAVENGASFFPHHEVQEMLFNGSGNAIGVVALNRHDGKKYEFRGDIVINATGAWAGKLASLVGIKVPVVPTPGIMVAYNQRLVNRVINRLFEPGDGDILIPQRRMVVIGTTSFEVEDPDYIPLDQDQIKQMYDCACHLVPAVSQTLQRGVYMSARPLIKTEMTGRSLSRTFKCYDHKESENIDGFVTITGGKATTCRAMAEKTADLVCSKLGISAICETKETPLVSYRKFFWH
ncbi:MAG: FAD-dependent oxidoreductase [Anaerolineae bacterium]|nr:FAD-dependent oxidoreductase [Anaerolineae bacterium]